MDGEQYLRHLSRESVALADVAERSMQGEVPACPGWTVSDLVEHVGQLHRWVSAMVSTRAAERLDRGRQPPAPASDEGRLRWFRDGAAHLLETLAEAGEESPVWNWTRAPDTARFWYRRMAHETAVHRWDAESAGGTPEPFDPQLAVDGIDEMLENMLRRFVEGVADPVDLGGTLLLRSEDRPSSWRIHVSGRDLDVRNDDGPADASVAGTASDILLFLYNRGAPDAVHVDGDRRVVASWRSIRV